MVFFCNIHHYLFSKNLSKFLHYLFIKKLSKFLRLKPTVEMARFLPLQCCFNLLELENCSRCQNNFKSRRYINLQSNSGTSTETNMSGGLCLVNLSILWNYPYSKHNSYIVGKSFKLLSYACQYFKINLMLIFLQIHFLSSRPPTLIQPCLATLKKESLEKQILIQPHIWLLLLKWRESFNRNLMILRNHIGVLMARVDTRSVCLKMMMAPRPKLLLGALR